MKHDIKTLETHENNASLCNYDIIVIYAEPIKRKRCKIRVESLNKATL